MKIIKNDYRYSPTSITTNYSIPNETYWSIPSYIWNTIDLTEYEKAIEKNKTKNEEKHMKINMPKIKNIDFQPPLTVVIWEDGTKTFVKCLDTDNFDPEKGAAMAIAKKALGDTYHYNDIINYYTEKYYKKHPKEEKAVDLSVSEQNIIWAIRSCGEEVEKFISDTLMEIYTGM